MRLQARYQFLIDKEVGTIDICGLARDYCAWWTAVDGVRYVDEKIEPVFAVNFIWDATLPVETPWDIAKLYPDYVPFRKSVKKH